ncbi:MAG: GTPase, partial [Patescibacteria group bacterium]|nr:GTPase [Patescibacteria group bacterium]
MLSIGIVGLPNVGKSTLFNALTKKSVSCENYPFCTIDPTVGVVAVPDERLWKLSDFSKSIKTIPAAIEFVDIAGLVEGASKGEGLGNKFLANIREVDAILHMVRLFPTTDKNDITHVYGNIDPLRDIEVINLELILADFETVNKRRVSILKEVKRGDKEAIKEDKILERVDSVLKEDKMANTINFLEDDNKIVKQLNLLTTKPVIYGLNKKIGMDNLDNEELLKYIVSQESGYVLIDAKIEKKILAKCDHVVVTTDSNNVDLLREFSL